MFLSKDSISAEIITAKSSEMNICVPKGDAGDFVSKTRFVFVRCLFDLCVCCCFSPSTLCPSSLRLSGMESSLSPSAVIFDL